MEQCKTKTIEDKDLKLSLRVSHIRITVLMSFEIVCSDRMRMLIAQFS